ncbi:hypothetical protein ACSBR1_001321 [Camellia fascicularis]
MRLVEDKGDQNWISRKNNKFIFPGGGTQFINGADQYLDHISNVGYLNTRVALDVGCGVASFGAYLLSRNVTTLSIAPKEVHENQIQFALERGVPAMVAVFATHRLLYPSQAFDLIHCSRCNINWARDDGILLLEVNRMLRAGGQFVWAAQSIYEHEDNSQEQWKEMENLSWRICWELIKREGHIAIWRKPLNNNCYVNRHIDHIEFGMSNFTPIEFQHYMETGKPNSTKTEKRSSNVVEFYALINLRTSLEYVD